MQHLNCIYNKNQWKGILSIIKTFILKSREKLTSQPVPGVGPSQFGGGPPYFLCPVVTSNGYPVLSSIIYNFDIN